MLDESERAELRATAARVLTSAGEGLWRQMIELGWTQIHVPEQDGGAGGSWSDLAVILYEMGAHLTSTAFVPSAVLAVGALLTGDNADLRRRLLPDLVSGTRTATVAPCSPAGSCDRRQVGVTWRPEATSLVLNGRASFVLGAEESDVVLVSCGNEEGIIVCAVDVRSPGVSVTPLAVTDPTRRLGTVGFDGVRISSADVLGAVEVHERVVALGALIQAADAVGVARRVTEMAGSYAREREQFGRPIGSFQAVKHMCADMVIAVETMDVCVEDAFKALDERPDEAAEAIGVAKSYAVPAGARVCRNGIQVHGGIGYTWEQGLHLYLRRAKLDEQLFGSPSWHRRRLADALLTVRGS